MVGVEPGPGLTVTDPLGNAPSIRAWLAVLPLLCIVPAALLVLALIVLDHMHDRREIDANTLGTARALATVVERQLAEVQAGLQGLATSPLLHQGALAQFHEQASRFERSQTVALNVVLIDGRGAQLVNTLLPLGTALPSGQEPEQLLHVFSDGKPVVTNLFTGPVTHRKLFAIGLPVRNGDHIDYALAAGVDPEKMRQLLTRQKFPASWIVAVVDRSGTIIARTVDHSRFAGEKASPELLEHIRDASEGTFDGLSKEGIEVRSVFSRSPATGWLVAIGIPRAELEEPLRESLAWLAFATLALLGGGLSIAWWMGRRVAGSVASLVTASVQLGRGQSVQVPPLAFREANHLGRAMALAGLALHEAHDDAESNAARLSAVLESALEAIVVVDPRNRIVTFNAAASLLFRHLPEEAIGMDFDRLFPAHLRGRRTGWLRDLPDNGSRVLQGSRDEPLQGQARGGELFAIDASVSKAVVRGREYLVLFARAAG